jgi:hypothetical protein
MMRTVFEPLKMAKRAKDCITRRYMQSEDTRWATTLVANIMQSSFKNQASVASYSLGVSLLQDRVYLKLAIVQPTQEAPPEGNMREILDALDDVTEVSDPDVVCVLVYISSKQLMSILCMLGPLSAKLRLLRAAAPLYWRARLKSPGSPIHLAATLLHPEFSFRHLPVLDIMASVCTCRPMLFQYDTTHLPEFCTAMLHVNDIGFQWMNGVPDQFVLMLARMNVLREESSPQVDPNIISELESKVKNFRPILGTYSDSYLTVARLTVQESWRQAMYIYLYMVSLV